MSYDLMVFAPEVAPRERGAFLRWYEQQTEWGEAHAYDDPAFAWSEAEAAHEAVVRLAKLHRIGFFDVSSDDPTIVFPDDPDSASPPAGGRTDKKSRWKLW